MQEISGLAKELLVSEEDYIHGVSSFALRVPSHFLSTYKEKSYSFFFLYLWNLTFHSNRMGKQNVNVNNRDLD